MKRINLEFDLSISFFIPEFIFIAPYPKVLRLFWETNFAIKKDISVRQVLWVMVVCRCLIEAEGVLHNSEAKGVSNTRTHASPSFPLRHRKPQTNNGKLSELTSIQLVFLVHKVYNRRRI